MDILTNFSSATGNWNPLGNINYRKLELYSMAWYTSVDLRKYFITAAPYGGPIAITRSESKSLVKTGSKPFIQVYTAAGVLISEKIWSSGRLVYMGWSDAEELLCIQDDGTVLGYDMFMNNKRTFGMSSEVKETKVLDCKVFMSVYGTGVAVLTTAYRLFIVSNIDDAKPRRLAEIPGLSQVPSCWEILNIDKNCLALVARESTLFLLDRGGEYRRVDPAMKSPAEGYLSIAISFDNKFVAMVTTSGVLWIGSVDLQKVYCEYDTKKLSKPKHLAWCGTTAVMAVWDSLMLVVGPHKDTIQYNCDGVVHLVQEVDGIRIISGMAHEFFTIVPLAMEQIFKIGSDAPGALLYDASKEFQRGSQKADEYIRLIKDKLANAVMQCIEAAAHEFDIKLQKLLLKAASFGKYFLTDYKPEHFVDMCRRLRVLNAIRDHTIGIPLSTTQLEHLTMPVLIDRLVFRKLFPQAIQICKFLQIPDTEGSSRILAHWACYKVQQEGESEAYLAETICNKLGNTLGVSYSEIASKAIEKGRIDLAIRLLEFEPRASEQVPLLLQMRKNELALQKAISSGDTDLVYTGLIRLKESLSPGDFLLCVQSYPVAHDLYLQYCRQQNRQKLLDMYHQSDDFTETAKCHVLESYEESRIETKIQKLNQAKDMFSKAKQEFLSKQTEEQVKLLSLQRSYEEKFGRTFVDLSVHQTIYQLSLSNNSKESEHVRKEFRVPERRFWWLRLHALAEAGDWIELEKFSRSKKSPIGYEPFLEICLKYNQLFEAAKYLPKISPENKVRCHVLLGKYQEAASLAYEAKNIVDLQFVLSKTPTTQQSLINDIQSMIERASSKK